MSPADLSDLTISYLRRERWKARLLAAELAPLLGGLWRGGSPAASNGRIPAHQMFAEMGIDL